MAICCTWVLAESEWCSFLVKLDAVLIHECKIFDGIDEVLKVEILLSQGLPIPEGFADEDCSNEMESYAEGKAKADPMFVNLTLRLLAHIP